MNYQCMNCKKEFPVKDKIQCPFCGYRIVKKTRPKILKRVKAE